MYKQRHNYKVNVQVKRQVHEQCYEDRGKYKYRDTESKSTEICTSKDIGKRTVLITRASR